MANTCLSPAEVSNLWTQNGGPPSALGDVIPVVWAESGGCTDPAGGGGAYGLTQIQGDPAARDPTYAIRKMIQMSNGGTNWAPWCSAWSNPGANCGHGDLPHVQPGSAAAKFLGLGGNQANTTGTPTSGGSSEDSLFSNNNMVRLGLILMGGLLVLFGVYIAFGKGGVMAQQPGATVKGAAARGGIRMGGSDGPARRSASGGRNRTAAPPKKGSAKDRAAAAEERYYQRAASEAPKRADYDRAVRARSRTV